MKINHSSVRGFIRFAVLTAFIASLLWRFYTIMKFGGKKSTDVDSDSDSGEMMDDTDAYAEEEGE